MASYDLDGMDCSHIMEEIKSAWAVKLDNLQLSLDATVQDLAQAVADRAHVPVAEIVPGVIAILGDGMSRDPKTILSTSRLIKDLRMG